MPSTISDIAMGTAALVFGYGLASSLIWATLLGLFVMKRRHDLRIRTETIAVSLTVVAIVISAMIIGALSAGIGGCVLALLGAAPLLAAGLNDLAKLRFGHKADTDS